MFYGMILQWRGRVLQYITMEGSRQTLFVVFCRRYSVTTSASIIQFNSSPFMLLNLANQLLSSLAYLIRRQLYTQQKKTILTQNWHIMSVCAREKEQYNGTEYNISKPNMQIIIQEQEKVKVSER